MDVYEDKKALRLLVNEQREKVPVSENHHLSKEIFNKIEHLEVFQHAKCILLYWSMECEVHTHDFVRKWNGRKKMCLPVIVNDGLKIKQYAGSMKMLKTSKLTIFEPTDGPYIDAKDIDLALVPGMAFDRTNRRLGHGKGYYDRLLEGMEAFKIGICFKFQLFDEIPSTKRDVKMDMVIMD